MGHMVEHNSETGHEVALSFSDGSFHCYSCDNYITNADLDKCRYVFGNIKHNLFPKNFELDWSKDPRAEAQKLETEIRV